MLAESFVSKIPIRLQGLFLLLLAPVMAYLGFYYPLVRAERGDASTSLYTMPAILFFPLLIFGFPYLLLGKKGYEIFYGADEEKTTFFYIAVIGGCALGGILNYVFVYLEVTKLGYR